MDAIPKMPEEWDGIELRQYLADKFMDSTWFKNNPEARKRAKAYRNEMIVRNL